MGNYIDRLRNPLSMAAYYTIKVGSKFVQQFVIGDVVIHHQEDFITTATFTVVGHESVNDFSRFMSVSIYGGSQDPNNQRYLFKGVIKKTHITFPKTGVPELTVTAYGGVIKGTREKRNIVYPSINCEREWAKYDPQTGQNSSIKLSDIVKNILSESFYQFPAEIDIQNDMVFTHVKNSEGEGPFIQSNTDWMALKELARMSNCILAEKSNDKDSGDHIILFIDREKNKNTSDKDEFSYPISFRYMERDMRKDYEFIVPFSKNGEILVDTVDFDMDVDLNSGSLRIVSDFNEGGDSKVMLQRYDEETEKIIFYELKNSLSGESDAVIDFIYKHAFDAPFEKLLPYLKEVDIATNKVPGYEESNVGMQGAGALGWVGYSINITFIGDIRVQPYRYYPITGLQKYSGRYYAKSVQHILGRSGYLQTINFYR